MEVVSVIFKGTCLRPPIKLLNLSNFNFKEYLPFEILDQRLEYA